jgi:hypothetical protein
MNEENRTQNALGTSICKLPSATHARGYEFHKYITDVDNRDFVNKVTVPK